MVQTSFPKHTYSRHALGNSRASYVTDRPVTHQTWGDEFDADACHSHGHEVYDASPAGCFPVGSSPHGCEDMGGNVWEWTRSALAEYPYPEQGPALEEREDPESNRPRVRRGGSFDDDPAYVRCAYRFNLVPGFRNGRLGFRVVLSPSSPSSEPSDP